MFGFTNKLYGEPSLHEKTVGHTKCYHLLRRNIPFHILPGRFSESVCFGPKLVCLHQYVKVRDFYVHLYISIPSQPHAQAETDNSVMCLKKC